MTVRSLLPHFDISTVRSWPQVQNLRHKNYILKLCSLYGPIDVESKSSGLRQFLLY